MSSDLALPSTLNPQLSTKFAVLVCEREPYWTPELQRQFHGGDIVVRGCQRWSDLAALSREFSRTVHVIDLEQCAAECLIGLGQRCREAHASPVVVLSSPRLAELENVLREAGAQAFFPELPTGADLARCCRRWLAP